MNNLLIMAGVILAFLIVLGLTLTRLYKRSTKGLAFIRTGFGGQKVITDGGAFVFPILHETINVNMNTLRLTIERSRRDALITNDRMRVDVQADFYVRVKNEKESIAIAAQSLGSRTLRVEELSELLQGKFVDALRAVSAEMTLFELHEKRADFVQRVQASILEDLTKNGLELESVSLTNLDQTSQEYFDPNNAFDSEGLTRLSYITEEKRKTRNDIQQNSQIAIEERNLEAQKRQLEIDRDAEYSKMQQGRELAIRKAEQDAEISKQQSQQQLNAEQAEIEAKRETELKRIEAERLVKQSNIQSERDLQAAKIDQEKTIELAEIDKQRAIQESNVQQKKTIDLAQQDAAIAIAQKSGDESRARAEAEKALAEAVLAEEQVETVRQVQRAERQKTVEVLKAQEAAERDSVKVVIAAEAEKKASNDRAEAIRIAAEAEAESKVIRAKAEAEEKTIGITAVAEAEKQATEFSAQALLTTAEAQSKANLLMVEAKAKEYEVEAKGKREINEAANVMSAEQINLQMRLALINKLPEIIRESVKPMESIDSIKIVQMPGQLNNINGASTDTSSSSLSDQVVDSALRYRAQVPLVDGLMKDLGLNGSSLNDLTSGLLNTSKSDASE